MNYIIYTDLHIGSPIQSMTYDEFTENFFLKSKANNKMVYLGDNFELVNTKNLSETYLHYQYTQFRNWDVFVNGNHDHDGVIKEKGFAYREILFVHSDSLKWGSKRSIAYRSQKMGKRKWWKFNWLLKFNDWFRHKTSFGSITRDYIATAVDIAIKTDCQTVVMGHVHPKELYDKVHLGIRVIVCPRGMTEIDL